MDTQSKFWALEFKGETISALGKSADRQLGQGVMGLDVVLLDVVLLDVVLLDVVLLDVVFFI